MGSIQFQDGVVLFGNSVGANPDKVAFHADCCCAGEVPCERCEEDTAPAQFQVVIAGLANASPEECATCTNYNDTYILDRVICPPLSLIACAWKLDLIANCLRDQIILHFLKTTGGVKPIQVKIWRKSGGPDCEGDVRIRFQSDDHETLDCSAISNLDLPFLDIIVAGDCDTSSATCKVTAL